MLDKKDFKDIKKLMQNALEEFFETLILPYFEHYENDHKEIKDILKRHETILKSHDNLLESHDSELDRISRKLEKNEDDHEEMFKRLDANDKDHKKMLGRLGSIDLHLQNQEKRINRLETIASV